MKLENIRDAYDNNAVCPDGGNLAALLYGPMQKDHRRFENVCWYNSKILPVFDRFQFNDRFGKSRLRWKSKGVDRTSVVHLTSEGSLLFPFLRACHIAIFSRGCSRTPCYRPLLDEPELGLHPSAVDLVGNMIKALSLDIWVIGHRGHSVAPAGRFFLRQNSVSKQKMEKRHFDISTPLLHPSARSRHPGSGPVTPQDRHPPPGPGGGVSSVPGAGRHGLHRGCPAEGRMVIPDRQQQGSIQ